MCGRFTLTKDVDFVMTRFNLSGKFGVDDYQPRFNIVPSQSVLCVIHDRMPVILSPEDEKIWLDRSIEDINYLKQFLIPYHQDMMEAFEVSAQVNSPTNDSSELIMPVNA